jgi:bifunctional DNA-binding transcriptional regulator/antitoxin component of YhaV-PrlF toxin-antitoxin module
LIHSTVSSQYQTTIPQVIRERLRVSKNDTIRYRIVRGAVVIEKAEPLAERLHSFHEAIRKKIANVKPGLTAREAHEIYATTREDAKDSERDSHDA